MECLLTHTHTHSETLLHKLAKCAREKVFVCFTHINLIIMNLMNKIHLQSPVFKIHSKYSFLFSNIKVQKTHTHTQERAVDVTGLGRSIRCCLQSRLPNIPLPLCLPSLKHTHTLTRSLTLDWRNLKGQHSVHVSRGKCMSKQQKRLGLIDTFDFTRVCVFILIPHVE